MFRAVSFFLACLALHLIGMPQIGSAGWYLKIEQRSRAIPWQADGTLAIDQYVSQDRTLTIFPDRIVILHIHDRVIYELDKANKTYTKSVFITDPSLGGGKPDGSAIGEDFLQNAVQALSNMMRVTATNQYRQLAGFHCRRYDADQLAVTSQIWATRDIKDYKELLSIGEKVYRLFENDSVLQAMNIMGILKEVDGFPIYTTAWLMGGTITYVVRSVENRELKSDFFQVPVGYKPAQRHR